MAKNFESVEKLGDFAKQKTELLARNPVKF
jgi:hypothetical protein